MTVELFFSRARSVAEVIEHSILGCVASLDAAIYRFNNPRLARAIEAAGDRGVRVRLLVDQNKFEESQATRELLAKHHLPFRVLYGVKGKGSKMHHKFCVLDGRAVMTGSYNWTLESEHQNYESLLVLDSPEIVTAYEGEFDELWAAAHEV
jgi:phosphatidylserine/phosphatidylglycerophosphate/cardiolipin synthase-like enzyme